MRHFDNNVGRGGGKGWTERSSVAATKLSSKFHAESFQKMLAGKLETFWQNFRVKVSSKISPRTSGILTKYLRKHYMRFRQFVLFTVEHTAAKIVCLPNSKFPMVHVLSKFRQKCQIYTVQYIKIFSVFLLGRGDEIFPKVLPKVSSKFWQNFMSSKFQQNRNTREDTVWFNYWSLDRQS